MALAFSMQAEISTTTSQYLNTKVMKNLKFALVALMLMCTCQTFAQKAVKDMTDKELSEYFALKVTEPVFVSFANSLTLLVH